MKFKEYVNKAIELQQTSAAFYREHAEKAQREITKTAHDPDLSAQGRAKKAAEVRQRLGNELLQAAAKRKQEYVDLLTAAKADAEATIKRGIKKPADEKVENFKKKIDKLKVELMLAPNFEVAERKINETMKQIDDPYFATMLADEFVNIVPQALSLAGDKGKAKMQLSQMYERLNNDYLPAEVKEARQAVEFINASLANPSLFSDVVVSHAIELFGREVGRNLNTPENYEEMGN
jgi:hypothetical protein